MTLKCYSLQPNLVLDLSQDQFPAILRTWQGNFLELSTNGTHFGFIQHGHPLLVRQSAQESYRLHPQMYFCLPNTGYIDGQNSSGMVITCPHYQGMFSIGGAIEPMGRFAYLDGGTNSLLIPPLTLGDPCLHAMYFPPGVDQTLHTHPSYRIGIIVAGEAEIETPEDVISVETGTLFLIHANSLHKFRTSDKHLTVVVFHPDSDTGFTHRDNPMLRRTMVGGVSATQLPQIQTKLL
jgi:hypothetical protein